MNRRSTEEEPVFDTTDDLHLLPNYLHVQKSQPLISKDSAAGLAQKLAEGTTERIQSNRTRSGQICVLQTCTVKTDEQPVMFYIYNPSEVVWYTRREEKTGCEQPPAMVMESMEYHDVIDLINNLQHNFTPIPISSTDICGPPVMDSGCTIDTGDDRKLVPMCCASYSPGMCNFIVVSDSEDISQLPDLFLREPVVRLFQLANFNSYVKERGHHTHGTFMEIVERIALEYDQFRVHQQVGALELLYQQKQIKSGDIQTSGGFVKHREDTSAAYRYFDGDLFPSSCDSVFGTEAKPTEVGSGEDVIRVLNPPAAIAEQESLVPGDALYFVAGAAEEDPRVCSVQDNDNRPETLRCKSIRTKHKHDRRRPKKK